jgi:hypothetical protein
MNFGRCIVHFAVDTDEIYMTTKLDGAHTFFPAVQFGNNFGKGNPPNLSGIRLPISGRICCAGKYSQYHSAFCEV